MANQKRTQDYYFHREDCFIVDTEDSFEYQLQFFFQEVLEVLFTPKRAVDAFVSRFEQKTGTQFPMPHLLLDFLGFEAAATQLEGLWNPIVQLFKDLVPYSVIIYHGLPNLYLPKGLPDQPHLLFPLAQDIVVPTFALHNYKRLLDMIAKVPSYFHLGNTHSTLHLYAAGFSVSMEPCPTHQALTGEFDRDQSRRHVNITCWRCSYGVDFPVHQKKRFKTGVLTIWK